MRLGMPMVELERGLGRQLRLEKRYVIVVGVEDALHGSAAQYNSALQISTVDVLEFGHRGIVASEPLRVNRVCLCVRSLGRLIDALLKRCADESQRRSSVPIGCPSGISVGHPWPGAAGTGNSGIQERQKRRDASAF